MELTCTHTYICIRVYAHMLKTLKTSHQDVLFEKYQLEFFNVLFVEKSIQQHHITTQHTQSCSIADHFQIRFKRQNNH